MLSQIDMWRRSPSAAIWLAVASSVFFALLFWFWERELLWMLAVLLPPIWSPAIYQRFGNDGEPLTGRLAGFLVGGLAALMCIGVIVYLIV